MRTILLLICICTTSVIFAQKDCATTSYLETEKISNPYLAKKLADIESFIQRHSSSQKSSTFLTNGDNLKTTPSVIRIPVVVHVLYNNDGQNISEKQIQSQIEALNRDFRRKNADTANTPARFRTIAADIQIEFYLATADPKGKATNGILRKRTSVTNWMSNDKMKFSAQGGDDAWDSKNYLNIWVCNLRGTLGYATAPGTEAAKDGLVINFSVFGTLNMSAPYEMGRTAVHEIGHWLGLKHIWGDTYCGDDQVNDTPAQGTFTSGCPSGFRSTCTNGSLGDMYMNYMDYTSDACLNMFTAGQKQRMRALFNYGGPRATLLSSKGLNQPWATEEVFAAPTTVVSSASIFPNPAIASVTITFNNDGNWVGKNVQILNAGGSLLQEVKINAQSQKLSLSALQPGIYFVKADNGFGSRFMQKLVKL